MKPWMNRLKKIAGRTPKVEILVVVALLAAFAGWSLRGPEPVQVPPANVSGKDSVSQNQDSSHSGAGLQPPSEEKAHTWTCSMHPQIRLPESGLCPICKMPLVPLTDAGGGERELVVTEAAAALMDIQTAPVVRRHIHPRIRMFGRVAYDETRLAQITAWVGGRIDELFVDFTGIRVARGDHMAKLYSPELYSAQAELLQAVRGVQDLANSDVELLRNRANATVAASREKLRLLGLSTEQIDGVLEAGAPSEHVTIFAPMSGIVIDRQATEGMYVKTGTRLYTVADLTHLWVQLDAYETDLPWIDYGRKVTTSTAALPGETFNGWIAFISPVVDERTRTVKVRVNVDNPRGRLKPDMFVHAVTLDDRLDLADKWVCPMHPEIIKDHEGDCDVCGMDLVRSEKLGYARDDRAGPAPVVVPVSAVLWTGERSVVYVRAPDTDKPTFNGREVVLGPRAGEWYIIESGLSEGEMVVTNGNFKIDSALQISAKPSMMSPDDGAMPPGHDHGGEMGGGMAQEGAVGGLDVPAAFREQLAAVWQAYLPMQKALAADEADGAATSAAQMKTALGETDMSLLSGPAHEVWMPELNRMRNGLDAIAESEDLKVQRAAFEKVSDALTEVIRRIGVEGAGPVYRVICPMAFGDRAAYWLQDAQTVRNPYWGPAMLECGEVTDTLVEPAAEAGDE